MPVFNHKYLDRDDPPADMINIMRNSPIDPGEWGNPFVLGRDGDRDEVLAKHKAWLIERLRTGTLPLERMASLHGANLLCACSPAACHGETLLEAAAWAVDELERRNKMAIQGNELTIKELAEEAVRQQPALIPAKIIPYLEWLDLTGRDDSFVGNGETVPGTQDLYEAAMRICRERQYQATRDAADRYLTAILGL